MTDDVIDKTLLIIRKQQLKPIPHWKFSLPNYLFWGSFTLLIFLSGVTFALVVRFSRDLELDAYEYLTFNRLRSVIALLPYFWFSLLILFAGMAWINLRYTRKGYRYDLLKVIGAVLGLSFGIGGVMYAAKTEEAIHRILVSHFPQVYQVSRGKENFWNQPQEGLLGGILVPAQKECLNCFGLIDFSGKQWDIMLGSNTIVWPDVQLVVAEKVKIIGIQLQEYSFQAREIRPWEIKTSRNSGHYQYYFNITTGR
jgi:hypothetical protein